MPPSEPAVAEVDDASSDAVDTHEIVARVREAALRARTIATLDSHGFPREAWRTICASGVLGVAMPRAFGGSGQSILTMASALTVLAREFPDEGLIFSLCAQLSTCMAPILLYGSEAQKRRWLPPLIRGDMIGGNGTSESEAGSDLSEMRTLVRSLPDGAYELEGVKAFVTNGAVADVLIIYARHAGGVKFLDTSAFIVAGGAPGLTVRRNWTKLGLQTSPLSEMGLERCPIPGEQLLGRPRHGMAIFNASMLWERIVMAAYLLGSMQRQFNETLRHCRERRQSGQSLVGFQMVAQRLAEMKRTIETSSALLQQTGAKMDRGEAVAADASLLKWHVSEGRIANSVHAMSLFGALGYTNACSVEAQLRDSMASATYSGTNDIQKRIVADALEEYA